MMTAAAVIIALLSAGCRRQTAASADDASDNTVTDASLLRIGTDDGRGYIPVDIVNPWDTTACMARLALVPRGTKADTGDRQAIEVPVERSIVTSAVHAAVIDSLGALGAVSGMADVMYVKQKPLLDAVADGRITDIGNSMSPSLERIISLQPQIILATPYENAGYGIFEQAGAVIIPCADYMEPTALGRAEWIRLLGLLYGHGPEADRWFADVRGRYTALRDRAADPSLDRPTVIKEMLTGGVWYVPGGASYQARLFADAGADYPWASDTSAGSLPLDFAAVYDRASDADIWLVQTFGSDLTLDGLRAEYPLNARFAAFGNGGVYTTDTSVSMLYEETPFSPDLLLREYINIFHPGLLTGDDARLRYYHRAE